MYDAVGRGHYDKHVSKEALDNTFYSVSIYEDEEIIGYGRIIGDAVCFLYIHDIMVIPEYQSKKVGTKVMNILLDKIKEIKKKNPYLRVYVRASEGREGFYKKFGFVERKDAGLGSGMVLKDI